MTAGRCQIMDKALKQRLVGASVLVALAVVVLPMLLGGETRAPQEARTIELPPKPRELSFETRRFPIGEQAPEQATVLPPPPEPVLQPPRTSSTPGNAGVAKQGAPATALVEPRPDEPATQTVTGPATQADEPALVEAGPGPDEAEDLGIAAPAPGPAPGVAAASSEDGRYLVQVASFSSTGNANRLAGQLGEAGMPVLMDTVNSAAGVLHRVRIGPFAERDAADRVIRDLNARVPDLQPRVLDLRPDDESAVTAPSDPLVRWVVQVGSFGAQENAEKLVFQLRDGGFRASSQAVSSGGATTYKVRVGPVLEREEAVALAASIRAQLGLDGLVMSTD